MPFVKQNIEQSMKMESTPLVYLEYTPNLRSRKNFFSLILKKRLSNTSFCMGYVSRPYPHTYRITTCRHLITSEKGELPSKEKILQGLEVFARYECKNNKIRNLMFEDVNVKIHSDILTDLLFIEINHPTGYNFKLLSQASVQCSKRYPGSQVFYFQNHSKEMIFQLFEGNITKNKVYVTRISSNGYFYYYTEAPKDHYRIFDLIDTTKKVLIKGASGSPILSRKGEVIGMICAHDQSRGKGIYLPIEKIERLYDEIRGFHS